MDTWPRVKELFHSALERDPAERAAFLNASCGDEDAVRAEVQRLLDAHARTGRFIEQSPVAMAGRVVGHCKIERLIGAGGMGEVYLARDVELGRAVAVKIALGTDADAADLKVGTTRNGPKTLRTRRQHVVPTFRSASHYSSTS